MTAFTVAEYRVEYNRADTFCQEVQAFRNEAGIPAMNELRNAGHHFLNSLDDSGQVAHAAELTSAVNHARRACYEASEAGMMYALGIIKKFKDDYETVTIPAVLPDYTKKARLAAVGKRLVEKGRQAGFDRCADHGERMDTFRRLRDCCEDMDAARPELNKLLAKERRNYRLLILGLAFALVAIVVTIAVAVSERLWPLNL